MQLGDNCALFSLTYSLSGIELTNISLLNKYFHQQISLLINSAFEFLVKKNSFRFCTIH